MVNVGNNRDVTQFFDSRLVGHLGTSLGYDAWSRQRDGGKRRALYPSQGGGDMTKEEYLMTF